MNQRTARRQMTRQRQTGIFRAYSQSIRTLQKINGLAYFWGRRPAYRSGRCYCNNTRIFSCVDIFEQTPNPLLAWHFDSGCVGQNPAERPLFGIFLGKQSFANRVGALTIMPLSGPCWDRTSDLLIMSQVL